MLHKEEFQNDTFCMYGTMDHEYQITIQFRGSGSPKSTHALLNLLTKMYAKIPKGRQAFALLDCSAYTTTPLRAQFSIGKWVLQNRSKTGYVAVVGAQKREKQIGEAIFKIAQIDRIKFFQEHTKAQLWLKEKQR